MAHAAVDLFGLRRTDRPARPRQGISKSAPTAPCPGRDGKELRVFAGHAAPVTSVAFSSTGSSILTGSDIVRLWRIADIAAGLECERDSNGLALRWKLGTLQRAENVNGPRLDVTNAASPLLISTDDPAGFFRVRAAAED